MSWSPPCMTRSEIAHARYYDEGDVVHFDRTHKRQGIARVLPQMCRWGGGVSGAYAACRLATAGDHELVGLRKKIRKDNRKLDIALYEISNRGRLFSLRLPAMPNTMCELGGGALCTTHEVVTSLVEKVLGLDWEPFPADQTDNLVYLGDWLLRRKQFSDPTIPPYDPDKSEQGLDPGELRDR
jgi:hypothetical protein